MPDGYVTGSSGMSYCNQIPFPPHEGWGLGTRLTYLGHVVGGGKVQMEPLKIRAIQNFEVPKTKKEVCSFLGLTGYYRKFIAHYASIASPLTDLTRKSEPSQIQWTPECDAVFRQLKDSLCSGPVLQIPDFVPKAVQLTAEGISCNAQKPWFNQFVAQL